MVKVVKNGGRAPQGWTLTTPWDLYKATFNSCDIFNKGLKQFRWPYQHKAHQGVSAEQNISDFIEAVILQNTFNAWTNLHEDDANMQPYSFLIQLSKELYQLALCEASKY